MRYRAKALDHKQGIVKLSLDAFDENDARKQLSAQGVAVLSLRKAGGWGRLSLGKGPFSLTLFTQELRALLDAGLTLVESVEALADKAQKSEARTVLEQITHHLYEGQTFSQALTRSPNVFPALYISTVRAAERTGALSQALQRYLDYRERLDVVRRKAISASLYPALLLIAGALVTAFLLGYVVPRFASVYAESGRELPWLSGMLLSWGRFIGSHGAAMALASVGLVAGTVYALTLPTVRKVLTDFLWQLPVIGERLKLYQLARFYRTASMLLSGGMPALTALSMSRDLLPVGLRASLDQASEAIRSGKPMSLAMELNGLTTPVALRMLGVGEKTGRMDEMMERIASFYDEDMARWVDWFTRIFEPLLMAVIGLLIGAIVVLMYMPVFELAGSLQ
ncbi:MAG TPA: type II secretion system F family protein [Thiobacillaceae bacterium]|nr:type II secretion system F family protein [Thiobacillaceae bacterium]